MAEYARRLWLFRDSGPAREIASLDAKRDCQRIAHLIVKYEHTWDMQRALELALFHTYGSVSVAKLLDRTGEFRRRGQRRYDDTQLLIGRFIEAGWDGELGRRAIARINEIHARYKIPNDDYLFVLSTFVTFPIRWMADMAWRPFTPHEALAWFEFWRGVGERMGMTELPETLEQLHAWVDAYERKHMMFDEANRRVADATVDIMRAWLPAPLRGVVRPVATALIDERLRVAFGYPPAPTWLRPALARALRMRAAIDRHIPLDRYPSTYDGLDTRSYGRAHPPIEDLGVNVAPRAPQEH